MTLTKKAAAIAALILGITAAAASPALAENHAPVSPNNTHATAAATLDQHAS
ncbi:hypothetical protein ACF073_16430 [Streptomyces sp. NPDC015171]|uniref:hypothetical protein n=1 Tax=Streptomyces sp. NPDC015171 TaxID=3364945 RepID=UPI0036F9E611